MSIGNKPSTNHESNGLLTLFAMKHGKSFCSDYKHPPKAPAI